MEYTLTIPDNTEPLDVEGFLNIVADIDQHITTVYAERNRLVQMASAPQKVEQVMEEFMNARDGQQPSPVNTTIEQYPAFVYPSGAHNAYPKNRVVNFEGELYRAKVTGVAHSPSEAPGVWERLWIVDGILSTTPPPDPETGNPDYPPYDPSMTYYPPTFVTHLGRTWELIHSVAAPGYEPGAAGMHAVWKDVGPA